MRAPLLDGLTVWPSYLLVYDTQKEKFSRYLLHISNMIFRFQILTKVTFHLQWETVSITFSSYTLIFWKLILDPQSIWGLLRTIKWVASEGHQTLVIWLRRSDIHQGDVYFSSMRIFIRGGHGILVNEWRLQRIIVTSATTVVMKRT